MTELDKLEKYLKEHGYAYERIRKNVGGGYAEINQILVYRNGEIFWDAICHKGSYGYTQGLLETYGAIVDHDRVRDSIEGFLTADDVIVRLKALEERYDESGRQKTVNRV